MKQIVMAMIPSMITTLAVVIGIFLDQKGLRRLETRMAGFGGRIDNSLNSVGDESDAFNRQLHQDFLKLAALDADILQRLKRLEERSTG